MSSKKIIAPKSPQPPYERTEQENRAIKAFQARRKQSRPLPQQVVEYGADGVPRLLEGHPDPAVGATLTMEALGLTRVPELSALLHQVADITHKDGEPDAYAINQTLAQIAAVEPKDGIEAMLATQMAAIHNAMLKSARALRGSDTIPQQDSNGNLMNKLARTFAAQVEALKRYRSKGEQKVVVEHVTVNEGGQAIVGAVNTGGRGSE